MTEVEGALPLEELLNAISAQLDRAQSALALKSQSTGLTFAVKDLTLDLRAMIDISDATLMIRPALPGEIDASTLKLSFTTVTRPMLEEHAVEMQAEEPAIADAVEGLSEEDVRRLEWVGVRNLSELNAARARGGSHTIRRLSRLPADRLKQALSLAGERVVRRVAPQLMEPGTVATLDPATRFRLRVSGRNLAREGLRPRARIDGVPASVLEVGDSSLVVAAQQGPLSGALTLEWPDGGVIEHRFDAGGEGGS